MTPAWDQLDAELARLDPPGVFALDDLSGLPEPVRRYFGAAVAPGTPLAAGARLRMRGRIKLGRWLPFAARQLLGPACGTVWAARVAGVISGSDRYVDGHGGMEWKLFGIIRLVHAEGDDVSRSAAGRVAGESIWVPTAALPGSGAQWSAMDDDHISVELMVDGHTVRLEHEIDGRGHLRSSRFERWGDPDNRGTWGPHPFGVEVTNYRTFGGVTIPATGRAGWHFGTSDWGNGEFFRFDIIDYDLVTPDRTATDPVRRSPPT